MTALVSLIAAALAASSSLIESAEDLHASGAIRPEAAERFTSLRTGLQQLSDQLDAINQAAEGAAPEQPDAAALDQLRHTVEALALTVDDLADQLRATKPASGA